MGVGVAVDVGVCIAAASEMHLVLKKACVRAHAWKGGRACVCDCVWVWVWVWVWVDVTAVIHM